MPTSRTLIVVALAVAAVVAALFVYSTSTSTPAQISYRGRTYANMVKVNAIEVRAHIGDLHPTGVKIDGRTVFISDGAPPRVVALELSSGQYDAYQLSG